MDYELVIDLTDANTQAFATNIQSLLLSLIPSFNIHNREQYFTSIQLKCNLNTSALPDAKILPTLQDLNNTKPTNLGGGLIKFQNIQRPKMETLLRQHKRRNIQHKHRMNSNNFATQTRFGPPNNNYNKSNHQSPLQQNEMESISEPKALAAVLPSPAHPVHPTVTHTKREDPPEHPPEHPPPHYHDLSPPPMPMPYDDEKKTHNDAHNDTKFPGYSLSDDEWQRQHAMHLQNEELEQKQDAASYAVDEDYALALRLQQELENADDDMKMAMELQKEEELRAKVERARGSNRYRNANFVDWGQRPGDLVNPSYYPQPSRPGGQVDDSATMGQQLRRWRPPPHEIMMNRDGSIPDVFRRLDAMQDRGDDNNDEDEEEAILNAFSHFGGMDPQSMDEVYGLHDADLLPHGVRLNVQVRSGRRRRRRVNDTWQRLPVRTLTRKDVDILSKSEEKKSCAICMNDFKPKDITRQLPCFHEFHKDCVDTWFQQQNDKGNDASCPLDRKKVKVNAMAMQNV